MKRTFIGTRIIIYYVILLLLLTFSIIKFSINPLFFSIMIGLFVILWTINRATILEVGDEIKVIDFYFFVPVVREKISKKEIESIKVTKMSTDDGLGITGNIILDIIVVFILGFYWSQPLSTLSYKLKGKTEFEKIKLTLPANVVKKVLA